MIKLKDLLLENDAPNIFIPRRLDDRPVRYNQMTQKEVNRIVDDYNNRKNKDSLDLSGSDPEEYDDDDGDEFSRSELSLSGDFIIPDTLKKVKRGLYLSNTGVTKLPDNLTIGEYDYSHLDVSYCKNLNALPKGLKVASVNGSYSGLIEIPDDIQTTQLELKYTKVKQLPLFKNFINRQKNIKCITKNVSKCKTVLLNQYKTVKKTLNALQKMYPNVKQFKIE